MTLKPNWEEDWDKIQAGEKFWKTGEEANTPQLYLSYFNKLFPSSKPHIFIPLCGDYPFVHLAWSEGYTVSALEFIPTAVERLKGQFEGGEEAWEGSECPGGKKWVYAKGRMVVYQADVFVENPELVNVFDAVLDKDAFGAIEKDERARYIELVAKYLKKGGILVSETKKKTEGLDEGPPYHLLEEEMRKEWEREGGLVYEEFMGSMYEWPGGKFDALHHRMKKV